MANEETLGLIEVDISSGEITLDACVDTKEDSVPLGMIDVGALMILEVDSKLSEAPVAVEAGEMKDMDDDGIVLDRLES